MSSRRHFLKALAQGAATLAVSSTMGASLASEQAAGGATPGKKVRWAFLVDTQKCTGCGFCVKACKLENEVPYDANVTRTWVERYVELDDGTVHADSPRGGRDGFVDTRVDLGRGRYQEIDASRISKAFFVPKLCNQCENPPCVQVCPVGATYQNADGVVLVDRSWCIGCGYCIMACPYGVRFFHPVYHTAEKCNFCYHRITKGLKPACVEACPFEARLIGNLLDPADPVNRIIQTQRVNVLKEEYGTKPQVYYVGLSQEVR
jgi:Fe-S-cluster-containing dehydrogenase component